MKKFNLTTMVLLLATLSFFSCSKKSDNDYFVKLKINGNWVTWKTVIGELGPDLANASKTDLGVTANNDASTDVFDLTIQINGSNFTTGTYASDNLSYFVFISYSKDVTTNAKFYDLEDAPTGPSSKYTINITSITDTELRGTFTGNYLYSNMADESINITEGEFFVRRAR